MASFTNQPPVDLHRPRPVRHPSPTSSSRSSSSTCNSPNNLTAAGEYPSTNLSSRSSPVKKTCHTSTGQHLHMNCPPRPLTAWAKKSRPPKSVTFQVADPATSSTLAVVFETEREDSLLLNGSKQQADEDGHRNMSGFINVPCSRRGFFCELDSDLDKLAGEATEAQVAALVAGEAKKVDHRVQLSVKTDVAAAASASPDGYDWQPSYVNLEDTEIAPVLLASSRPIDESHDFWKPRSVNNSLLRVASPVYDSPKTASNNNNNNNNNNNSSSSSSSNNNNTSSNNNNNNNNISSSNNNLSHNNNVNSAGSNSNNEDNHINNDALLQLAEFPFRYAAVNNANGRRSISNSSGSDTQVRRCFLVLDSTLFNRHDGR